MSSEFFGFIFLIVLVLIVIALTFKLLFIIQDVFPQTFLINAYILLVTSAFIYEASKLFKK